MGIASQSNVMSDIDLFKPYIQPVDFSFRAGSTFWSGNTSQVDIILADVSNYGLPFTSIQSTQFNVPYLCHYQAWKPRSNLFTDVCVATLSFFMVFWGAFNLTLTFFAKRTSVDGK